MTNFTYLVTVKLPKRKDHDPHNKQSGVCPVSGHVCTNITGEHHSYMVVAESIEQATGNAHFDGYHHVTRVEQV